jgi:hypothetical protein
MRQQPRTPGGPGTALYARAGTILVTAVLVGVAALANFLVGALYVAYSDEVGEAFEQLGYADAGHVFRVVGIVYLVMGVLALLVAAGVLRVRAWARYTVLAIGTLTLLTVALRFAATREVAALYEPNLALLTAFLLLRPGVREAFAEAKANRAERRALKAAARRGAPKAVHA